VRPTLAIISGPPAAGKTTLAHALAPLIPCPAICRDEIKEGMVHAYGPGFEAGPSDELTQRTFPLFFEVIRTLVAGGVTVVAEAAFQDARWRTGLEPLLPVVELRVVQCHVDEDVARERLHRQRAAHGDRSSAALAALAGGQLYPDFERLSLDAPSIHVDATDGYTPSLDTIAAFVR
jgi:predicted kinase